MTRAEAIEKVGELADRSSWLEMSLQLDIPPSTHCEQMKKAMREITVELRDIYKKLTGQNPWEEEEKLL
jgi:hypothetical protein